MEENEIKMLKEDLSEMLTTYIYDQGKRLLELLQEMAKFFKKERVFCIYVVS